MAKDTHNRTGLVEGTDPIEVHEGTIPANRRHPSAEPAKKMPRDGVTQFRVRTYGLAGDFRRAGIAFTKDDKLVDASTLTREQQIELLNTVDLHVEEIGGTEPTATAGNPPAGTPAEAIAAAHAAGVSVPGGDEPTTSSSSSKRGR